MQINEHYDPETGEAVIELRFTHAEDANGRLRQWATYNQDRLIDFARMYAGQRPASENDSYWMLTNAGRVTQLATRELEAVMAHAQTELGMSLGTIATALDRSKSTVQTMMRRIRAGRTTEVDDHPTIPAGDLRRGSQGGVYVDGRLTPPGTYRIEHSETVLTVHRDGSVTLDGDAHDLLTDPRLP